MSLSPLGISHALCMAYGRAQTLEGTRRERNLPFSHFMRQKKFSVRPAWRRMESEGNFEQRPVSALAFLVSFGLSGMVGHVFEMEHLHVRWLPKNHGSFGIHLGSRSGGWKQVSFPISVRRPHHSNNDTMFTVNDSRWYTSVWNIIWQTLGNASLLQDHVPIWPATNTFVFCSAKPIHGAFGRKQDLQAMLWNDGHVFVVFGEHIATLCNLDLTYYPFDSQHCIIRIASWLSVDDFVSTRQMFSQPCPSSLCQLMLLTRQTYVFSFFSEMPSRTLITAPISTAVNGTSPRVKLKWTFSDRRQITQNWSFQP